MATRFYLPSGGTSPLPSLATTTTWASLGASFFRAPTAITKAQDSALADFANTFPSTATQYMGWAQWVSEPIEAHNFTTAETYKFTVRNVEGNAAVDATTAFILRVVSGDGSTVRGTLVNTYTGGEFAVAAATCAATSTFSAAVSAQAGDRIVIELGAHGITPSTAYDATMRFGDPSATADFSWGLGNTTDLCPWVELSPTLSFQSVATALTAASTLTGFTAGSASIANTPPQACAMTAASTLTGFTAASASLTSVTPGATLELLASAANLGTGPGVNSPLTTEWFDTSESGNHGTLTGFGGESPWQGTGTQADPYRCVFNGTSDYVSLPDMSLAESLTFTYEAWVMFSGNCTGPNIISEGISSGTSPFTQLGAGSANDQNFTFKLRNNAGTLVTVLSTANTYGDGNPHHVVGTCDGSTMRLYVDGEPVGTPAAPPSAPYSIDRTRIGVRGYGSGNDYFWSGAIYAVRLYSSALTPEQVAQNYDAGGVLVADTSSLAAASTLTGHVAASATLGNTPPAAKTLTAASTLTGFTAASAALSHTPPAAKTLTAASTLTGFTAASASLSWTAPPAKTMTAVSTLTAFTAASASLSWTAAPARTMTAASTLTGFTAGTAALGWSPATPKTLTASSTLTGFTAGSASIAWSPATPKTLTAASTLTGFTAGSASLAWSPATPTVLTAASTLTAFVAAAAALANTAPTPTILSAASTLTAFTAATASLSHAPPAAVTLTGTSTLTGMVAGSAALSWIAPTTLTAASTLTAFAAAAASLSHAPAAPTTLTAASTLTGFTACSAAIAWTAATPTTLSAASTLTGLTASTAALAWSPATPTALTAASTLTGMTAASTSLTWSPGPAITAASTLTGFTSGSASLTHTPPAARILTAASTLTGFTAGSASLS